MTQLILNRIVKRLKQAYPEAKIKLKYRGNWELVVAVILSAQCTDTRVNEVCEGLFKKYPTVESFAKAPPEKLAKDIRAVGLYRNKAKNIIQTAKILVDKYRGKVPATMRELLSLPGVARKTANVILGNAFGKVEGIAVDTHVARISQRLRLVDIKKIGGRKPKYVDKVKIDYYAEADAVKIEKQLMEVLSQKEWFKFTYLMIEHGRAVCKAVNPQCGRCVLKNLCPVRR